MIPHQYLFGGVSIGLGLVALVASLSNYPWFFELAKVRALETLLGRRGARWTCVALGLLLVALGAAIALGLIPNRRGEIQTEVWHGRLRCAS